MLSKNEGLKFGYVLPHHPFELILENAILAEKCGFDSLWMTDHLVGIGLKKWNALEAWSVLAALSLKIARPTLGACVSDPHRRHPAVLAQATASLDIMSKGRTMLGIGAGEAMNLRPYGVPWEKPVSRMKEAITVIKKLWTEESVSFSGEFFELTEAMLSPKPLQKPHPPIWVAANSERTMRITAGLGDGWIPTAVLMTPQLFQENLVKIKGWAQDAGRNPSAVEPAVFLCTAAAEDRETARNLVDFPAKILLSLTPRLLKDYGVEPPPEDLHISQFVFNPKTVPKLIEEVQKIPPKPVEDIFVFGTPEDCITGIEKYVEAGVKHFLLNFFAPPKLSSSMMQFYAENVLSYFQDDTKK